MNRSLWRPPVIAILVLPLLASGLLAGDAKQPTRTIVGFGILQSPSDEEAKAQALAWLKAAGKADAQSLKAFDATWQSDSALLDRVADTLALGNPEAARLLQEVRDRTASAPQAIPVLLRDSKQPVFFRANLALAYARALSNRRVYEEALEVLQGVRPEQVVDPAAYLFHRAVCEYALMKGQEADKTLTRLLDDVPDAPERYRMVATLMHYDMQNWQEKDLGWIKRKMDNIERRLDLARGGPKTQKMQKEVIARLDELIKQLENRQRGDGQANDGNCPSGGQPGASGPPRGIRSTAPARDSGIAPDGAPGQVDPRRFKEIADVWGKLPERERARAIVELTRDLPPRYREYVENYFRKLAEAGSPR